MIEKTYNVGIYCRLSNDDERDAVKQEVIHPDYIIPRLTAHVKDVVRAGHGSQGCRPR